MVDYKIQASEIDNAIFEIMRLACVYGGYLPDFKVYANSAAYNAAKAAIITDGKQVIEVFSTGSYTSAGTKNYNNIIIYRGTPKPSQTGKGQNFTYQDNGTGFDKFKESDTLYTIPYKISFSCETQQYADIIEGFILSRLGARKFLTGIKDDESLSNPFWLIQTGQFDTSGKDFIERGFSFEARDIDLVGSLQVGTVGKFDVTQFDFQTTIIKTGGNELVDIASNVITNEGNNL